MTLKKIHIAKWIVMISLMAFCIFVSLYYTVQPEHYRLIVATIVTLLVLVLYSFKIYRKIQFVERNNIVIQISKD
jgi:Ca2+/Na+ antiporter